MRRVILFCIILVGFNVFAGTRFSNYQIEKSDLKQKIWSLDDDILIVKKIPTDKNFKFKKFIDLTLKTKKKALMFLGANNWTAVEKDLRKKDFIISGNYKDNKGQIVQFIEYQKHSGNEVKQILLTRTNSHQALRISEYEKELKEFLNAN